MAGPEFVLERGNGVYLFDLDGNRYLDFVSGLAVNGFGYGDYDILKAIEEQAAQLMHCSNLYHTIPSTRLAKELVENSFADRVFFCNSGTELAGSLPEVLPQMGQYQLRPAQEPLHRHE